MAKKQNLLVGGFSLAARNWPAFLWTYVFNLGLAWIFSLPLQMQINEITAHSLASQRLGSAFDMGVMVELFMKLGQGPGPAMAGSYFSIPIYLVIYFLIVPGTLVCYQSGAPAKLFSLIETGFAYFWRFVRITLVSLVIFIPVLGGLDALQRVWRDHVDATMVGKPAFLIEMAGWVIIALVASAIRIYFDLMQVYTVQLGLYAHSEADGSEAKIWRQIRRTFKPAWKAFVGNFFRIYLSFILLSLAGLGVVAITARGAIHSLAAPHMWQIFVLTQLGLFILLYTRFWQRGAETILALENPMPVPVEESASSAPSAEAQGGAAEFSI